MERGSSTTDKHGKVVIVAAISPFVLFENCQKGSIRWRQHRLSDGRPVLWMIYETITRFVTYSACIQISARKMSGYFDITKTHNMLRFNYHEKYLFIYIIIYIYIKLYIYIAWSAYLQRYAICITNTLFRCDFSLHTLVTSQTTVLFNRFYELCVNTLTHLNTFCL